jgi:hypothetical protein
MVDGIFTKDEYDFRSKFLEKLGVKEQVEAVPQTSSASSKSNFGSSNQDMYYIATGLILLAFVFFLMSRMKTRPSAFAKMF